MDHYDELKLRELTSRMGGHAIQEKFLSLVWAYDLHPLLEVQLPVLMDNLDEMGNDKLSALNRMLSKDACRSAPKIAHHALGMALRNASDGQLFRWAEVMERHYERFLEDEHFIPLETPQHVTVARTMFKYDQSFAQPVTMEQEWSLLKVTAMGMDGSNPAVKGELSGNGRWIRDVELVRYIADNPSRVEEIVAVLTELKVMRPVEIEACLSGNTSPMMSGLL